MAKKQLTIEEKLQAALVPVEEQPYKVPENWCWSYLENVCQIIMGQSPKGADTTLDDSYTPLIGGAADLGDTAPIINKYTKSVTKLSQCGDLIICIRATLGRPVVADGEYCLGRGVAGFRSSQIDVSFLRFFFINFERYLYDNATGSTFAQVTSKVLGKMPIPLPPFLEQYRIVARIESLFAKLDEAKEKIQEVLDGADLRRAAILHQAFTGKLTEKWRRENGVSGAGWQDVYIEDIAQVKGGKRVPKGMSLTDENTGHPYIKAGNLKQGTVISDNIMFVPDDVLPYIKNYTVNVGDVYITNVGACIGDCGVIPVEFDGANLTENAVKLTELECDSYYLAKYISSDFVQIDIKTRIASATLGKLSIANIKKIKVKLPTLSEQKEIVRLLDNLLSREQSTVTACEEALTTIDTLKKSILARAFRGELGTNDPAEPSAQGLLQEILEA